MAIITPLNKRTNNGFTVMPNRLVDQILGLESTHAVDTLALALYLVRHIPGQRASLALTGEFSQATICADLGWGKTNRARLKRALADLEQLDIVVSELRDNNTIVLHIDAEMTERVGETTQPLGYEHFSHPSQKDFKHPPCKESSQVKPSRAFVCINNKNNKITKNQIHHSTSVTKQPHPIPADQIHNDEVEKLLDLYCKTFNKSVSSKIRQSFAENYQLNQRPYNLVLNGFQVLSKHPKLRHDTASPNAVWELDFMQKSARSFEIKIRQTYFDEAMRRRMSPQSVRALLHQFSQTSGYHVETMLSYFEQDFLMLQEHLEITQIQSPAFPIEDTDAGLDSIINSKELDSEALSLAAPKLVISENESIDNTPTKQSCQFQPVLDQNSLTNETETHLHLGLEASEMDSNYFKNHQSESISVNANLSDNRSSQSTSVPAELLSARTKKEMKTLIDNFLQKPQSECVYQRLVTLSEFASLESTTYDMLKRLINIHTDRDQERSLNKQHAA